MIRLIIKESRQLNGIVWLWAILVVISYGGALASYRFDQLSFHDWCGDFCISGLYPEMIVALSILAIFVLITANCLYPRELDDSTIEFLYSLPVGKWQLFVSKCIAAWIILSLLVALSYMVEAALLAMNQQSLDGRFYAQMMLRQFARDLVFIYVILGYGLLLSRLRAFGWFLCLLYPLVLWWWEQSVGRTGLFNVFQIYYNDFYGETLQFNYPAFFAHGLVATLCYLFAYLAWSRVENGRSVRQLESGASSRWGTVFSVLAFVLLGLSSAYSAFLTRTVGGQSVHSTGFYDFIAFEGNEDLIDDFKAVVDDDHEQLGLLLGTPERPRVVADLTAEKQHVGGLAKWKKVLLDISEGYDSHYYRRVLAHETTHVYQSVLSSRELSRHAASSQFFSEGMAQYLSFRVVDDPETLRKNRLVAALAWFKLNIRFEQFVDSSLFPSRYDAELVYTLGETWVTALVQACGESVLGDLLRSMASETALRSLQGRALWQYLLNSVSCAESKVNTLWSENMKLLMPHGAEPWPDPGPVRFSRKPGSDRFDVEAQLTGTHTMNPDEFVIRIADARTLTGGAFDYFTSQPTTQSAGTVRFTLPADKMTSGSIRYQFGYRPEPDARVFYGLWKTASVE